MDTNQTPEKLKTRAVQGQDKILCQLGEDGETVEGARLAARTPLQGKIQKENIGIGIRAGPAKRLD